MSYTTKELKELFQERHAKLLESWSASDENVLTAVTMLSEAVSSLKKAGVDIDLKMKGQPNQMAFKMNEEGSCTVPICGTVTSGHTKRMIALFTKRKSQECLQWGLSSFDIEGQDGDKDMRPKFYKADNSESLQKLQEELIRGAVRDQVLYEHDTHQAFTPAESTQSFRRVAKRKPSRG